MAESFGAFGPPPTKVLCRYFMHGACRLGSRCHYSHDRQDKPDNVCKFYLGGCCSYADKCRYDHTKPRANQSPVKSSIGGGMQRKLPPPLQVRDSGSSNMVSLKKALKGETDPVTPKTPKPPDEWVLASEFIPGQPYCCSSIPSSYALAAVSATERDMTEERQTGGGDSGQLLCPYSATKECPYGEECVYTHGEICDLCGCAVLHPHDTAQRESHRKECMAQHEHDMALSFAVAVSRDKQCGICMDTVMDKEPVTERRFGIMSDCTHCFCLSCIRQWRNSKQFDSKTIRSCPECRVQSDFVTPSKYWVETKEEKLRLICEYKKALGAKHCKYFDKGRGECPFNDKCFYMHEYPDGTKATPAPRAPRHRENADGERDLLQRIFLWDFLEERQTQLESILLLELEDDLTNLLIRMGTDSSDSSDDDLW